MTKPATRADGTASTRRTYQKASLRRSQILARAIQLFAEKGVGASLRAIGESIGVSHAALRYYFASRDELLVDVYREHEAAITEQLPDRASPVAVMLHSAEQNRSIPGLVQLYATLTTDALQVDKHPAAHEFIRGRFRAVRAELTERIRDAQRAGTIAPDIDSKDAASLVIAASDGLQVQWLLEPDTVDVSRVLQLLERLFPGSTSTASDDR